MISWVFIQQNKVNMTLVQYEKCYHDHHDNAWEKLVCLIVTVIA